MSNEVIEQTDGEALLNGLIDLTARLDKRGEADTNAINLLLFNLNNAVKSVGRDGWVSASMNWHGRLDVKVTLNRWNTLKIYKRNKWFMNHDSWTLGLETDRAKDITKILDFLYEPFDPDTATPTKDSRELRDAQ